MARVILIALFGLSLGLAAFVLYLHLPPHDAGRFNRAEMESLVTQVRKQPFTGVKSFKWAFISGRATLLTGAAPINEIINGIFAERAKNQKLKMAIVVNDEGHFGTYGFAYSDGGFTPVQDSSVPDDRGRLVLDVPGSVCYTYPKMQKDAHWWEVFDELE